jgi:hypothetical protein
MSSGRSCRRACRANALHGRSGPGYGSDSHSRIILPGQSRNAPRNQPHQLILPGQSRGPPKMPPGQGNFPELAQESDLGRTGTQQATGPRNFRLPPGVELSRGGGGTIPKDASAYTNATQHGE